jgi:hypothetical protein
VHSALGDPCQRRPVQPRRDLGIHVGIAGLELEPHLQAARPHQPRHHRQRRDPGAGLDRRQVGLCDAAGLGQSALAPAATPARVPDELSC